MAYHLAQRNATQRKVGESPQLECQLDEDSGEILQCKFTNPSPWQLKDPWPVIRCAWVVPVFREQWSHRQPSNGTCTGVFPCDRNEVDQQLWETQICQARGDDGWSMCTNCCDVPVMPGMVKMATAWLLKATADKYHADFEIIQSRCARNDTTQSIKRCNGGYKRNALMKSPIKHSCEEHTFHASSR